MTLKWQRTSEQIRIALEKNPDSLPSSVEDLEPEDNFQLLGVAYNECPACREKILPDDRECPHCGIKLDQNRGNI